MRNDFYTNVLLSILDHHYHYSLRLIELTDSSNQYFNRIFGPPPEIPGRPSWDRWYVNSKGRGRF